MLFPVASRLLRQMETLDDLLWFLRTAGLTPPFLTLGPLQARLWKEESLERSGVRPGETAEDLHDRCAK